MDERRQWFVVFGLLALGAGLVFFAFQFTWFTVSVERPESVFEVNFDLKEYDWGLYLNEDPDPQTRNEDYSDDMELKSVMKVTEVLFVVGILGVLLFGILLFLYYSGSLAQTKGLYAAWIVAVASLLLGLLFFSFTVANAADNDARQIAADVGVSLNPEVRVQFWDGDGQAVGFGDLLSSPGASWFLAILGLANVVGSTVVLFRFPEAESATVAPL